MMIMKMCVCAMYVRSMYALHCWLVSPTTSWPRWLAQVFSVYTGDLPACLPDSLPSTHCTRVLLGRAVHAARLSSAPDGIRWIVWRSVGLGLNRGIWRINCCGGYWLEAGCNITHRHDASTE